MKKNINPTRSSVGRHRADNRRGASTKPVTEVIPEVLPGAPLPVNEDLGPWMLALHEQPGWAPQLAKFLWDTLVDASVEHRGDVIDLVEHSYGFWLKETVEKRYVRTAEDADARMGVVAAEMLTGLLGVRAGSLTTAPRTMLAPVGSPAYWLIVIQQEFKAVMGDPSRTVGRVRVEPAGKGWRLPVDADPEDTWLTVARQLAHPATQAAGFDRVWFGTNAGFLDVVLPEQPGEPPMLKAVLWGKKGAEHHEFLELTEAQLVMVMGLIGQLWAIELRPMDERLRKSLREMHGAALGQVLMGAHPGGVLGQLIQRLGGRRLVLNDLVEETRLHPHATLLMLLDTVTVTGAAMRWDPLEPGTPVEVRPQPREIPADPADEPKAPRSWWWRRRKADDALAAAAPGKGGRALLALPAGDWLPAEPAEHAEASLRKDIQALLVLMAGSEPDADELVALLTAKKPAADEPDADAPAAPAEPASTKAMPDADAPGAATTAAPAAAAPDDLPRGYGVVIEHLDMPTSWNFIGRWIRQALCQRYGVRYSTPLVKVTLGDDSVIVPVTWLVRLEQIRFA